MEKHSLVQDFPEHKEKIHELKMNSNHFKKLFDDYDVVNRDIHRIETGAEFVTEDVMNEMHTRRLHIKDQLFALLNK